MLQDRYLPDTLVESLLALAWSGPKKCFGASVRVLAVAFSKGRLLGKVFDVCMCLQLGTASLVPRVACLLVGLRGLQNKATEEEVLLAAKEVGNARQVFTSWAVHLL